MSGRWILFGLLVLSPQVISSKVCTIISDFVDYGNIGKYEGCTKVNGNIRIVSATFEGDVYNNYPGLHPDAFEVFSTINTITGYLLVQGSHPDFKSLSYFRNLEVIEGEELRHNMSLQVYVTSLESLDLSSLRIVSNGNVFIYLNNNLCYVDTINYSKLLMNNHQRAIVKRNKPNTECVREKKICHPRCDDDGCWGNGTQNCAGEIIDSNKVEDWVVKSFKMV